MDIPKTPFEDVPPVLVIVSPEAALEMLNACEAICEDNPIAARDVDDLLQISYLGLPVLVPLETATRWKKLVTK